MDDYAVIIPITTLKEALSQIEILQQQINLPKEYHIICEKQLSLTDTMSIINLLDYQVNKPKWNFKTLIDGQTRELAIDELFRLDKIQTKYCLYTPLNISSNFFSKLKEKFDKNIWYYQIYGCSFFGTVLCKYFYFDMLEKGIIANGLDDHLYREHTITQL